MECIADVSLNCLLGSSFAVMHQCYMHRSYTRCQASPLLPDLNIVKYLSQHYHSFRRCQSSVLLSPPWLARHWCLIRGRCCFETSHSVTGGVIKALFVEPAVPALVYWKGVDERFLGSLLVLMAQLYYAHWVPEHHHR